MKPQIGFISTSSGLDLRAIDDASTTGKAVFIEYSSVKPKRRTRQPGRTLTDAEIEKLARKR